jgi:WD40 repeat protein
VATASEDKTARIWSTQTGRSIVLAGHEDVVSDAEFSPNGRWIVTASRDHTARIWDSTSGKLVLLLTDHTNADTAAAFSPDGDSIATSSADKTASIEKVALKNPFDKTQDLVDDAKQVIDRCLTIEQRAAAALDPEPPAWCVELAKWPYASDQWKTWLAQKQQGHATPLPAESLQ